MHRRLIDIQEVSALRVKHQGRDTRVSGRGWAVLGVGKDRFQKKENEAGLRRQTARSRHVQVARFGTEEEVAVELDRHRLVLPIAATWDSVRLGVVVEAQGTLNVGFVG